MLNTAAGLYRIKRSKDLIKVKKTLEYSLPVNRYGRGLW